MNEQLVDATRPPALLTSVRFPRLRRRARNASGDLGWTALQLALFIAIWWAATAVLDRPRVFPPPPLVLDELIRIASGEGVLGSTYVHIYATMYRLVAAFCLSMLLGTLLGIIAGRVPFIFNLLDNIVWVFMAVPSVVWVFTFLVAMGITEVVPILAVSALLTPIVLITVSEGVKALPQDILGMARSYKASQRQMLIEVFLPYLVPYIASSARVAFALAIKLIIIAEVVGLASGIGYEVKYWYSQLFIAPIAAWGIVLIAIGLLVDHGLFAPLEKRAGRWKGSAGTQTSVRGRALDG